MSGSVSSNATVDLRCMVACRLDRLRGLLAFVSASASFSVASAIGNLFLSPSPYASSASGEGWGEGSKKLRCRSVRLPLTPTSPRKRGEGERASRAHEAFDLVLGPGQDRGHRLLVQQTCDHLGLHGLHVDLMRSEEHTSELQSLAYLVCRLLLEKKKY